MEEEIKKIFKDILNIDDSKFNDELSQDNCMSWDSLNHLKIVTSLEKQFNIKFSVDDTLAMVNVKIVKERLKKRINS